MNAPVAFPIITGEIDRGRDVIRVALDEFKGNKTLDCRAWWTDGEGSLRPGRGLTIGVRHLPALAEAIDKALAKAREMGLVE